ncbi:MAG TPA: hypothetical protein VHY35_01150 [Stellaceae bacterium]|jgi:hypothetical protein|nr:hypothetical protein [Stellaceae bacterium]
MLRRFATIAAVTSALALPVAAFAQDSSSYFIVQDMHTKKCTIVDKKPTTTESTVVGPDGVVYKTRTEAEGAMKTVKVCTSN